MDDHEFLSAGARTAIREIFEIAERDFGDFGTDFAHENDRRGQFVGSLLKAARERGLDVRATTYGPEEGETGADIGVAVWSDTPGIEMKGFIAQIKRDDSQRPLSDGVGEIKEIKDADER